jgi:hypothetical protein
MDPHNPKMKRMNTPSGSFEWDDMPEKPHIPWFTIAAVIFAASVAAFWLIGVWV